MDPRNTRDTIEDALERYSALELVYFYCHGRHVVQSGASSASTYLEVGRGEHVTAEDIKTWNSEWDEGHWKSVSPLVIINGCHTTDITPEALSTFVDALTGAYAAGVIGTETTVWESVASEAAERVFKHLCAGCNRAPGYSVGESIRRMRFELLRKGNLMGLTYTAYCSTGLALSVSEHSGPQPLRGDIK